MGTKIFQIYFSFLLYWCFPLKPKLLVLTSTFPRWANDTDPPFVYELSRRLTDQFSVVVLTPHYSGAKVYETLNGMEIYRFRYFFAGFEKLAGQTGILPTLKKNRLYWLLVPFFLFAQLVYIVFLSCRLRPNLIHAHWLIPQGGVATLVGLFTGIPVVVTAHGGDVYGFQSWLFSRIKSLVVSQAASVTVVSRSLFNVLVDQGANRKKIRIIPMGVDGGRFFQTIAASMRKSDYQPELLFVGRLSEKKGVEYLLRAMPKIIAVFPRARLRLVGGGELENELRQLAEALGVIGSVEFLGALTNIELPAFYSTSDIFIGPSIQVVGGDTEGFGLTFVEASLSGCLVIGTKVGGISDIIKDGETGFLVPERDSEAIAEKVIFAWRNWTDMLNICHAAQHHCLEKFDWKIIGRRYAELLKSVA